MTESEFGYEGLQLEQFRNAKKALREELQVPETGFELVDEKYISAVITAVLDKFEVDVPHEAMLNLDEEAKGYSGVADFLVLEDETQETK